mgnify:CR=1 FL=1
MNIFLNKKKFYLFILFYSLLAIFFALYVEYILQYKPCKLCLYQRIPYIFAIFISFVGYNYFKNDKILKQGFLKENGGENGKMIGSRTCTMLYSPTILPF